MFVNGSVWRPPNCTTYLEEAEKEEENVKKEVKEEKKPQAETKPSKPSRKGLLSDRYVNRCDDLETELMSCSYNVYLFFTSATVFFLPPLIHTYA